MERNISVGPGDTSNDNDNDQDVADKHARQLAEQRRDLQYPNDKL